MTKSPVCDTTARSKVMVPMRRQFRKVRRSRNGELLREVVLGLRRLAILGNVGNPLSVLETEEVQGAARTLGLEVATPEIRRAEDIAPAFDSLKGRADALYVCLDPVLITHRIRIKPWRSPCDCRQCLLFGTRSKREG
jgi:hypothetical protein